MKTPRRNPAATAADTFFVRRPDALEAVVGPSVVVLKIDTGKCFGFDGTGAAVWQMLEAPVGLDALCERLLALYAVDRATCRRQVTELLDHLLDLELIDARTAAPAA